MRTRRPLQKSNRLKVAVPKSAVNPAKLLSLLVTAHRVIVGVCAHPCDVIIPAPTASLLSVLGRIISTLRNRVYAGGVDLEHRVELSFVGTKFCTKIVDRYRACAVRMINLGEHDGQILSYHAVDEIPEVWMTAVSV